MSDGSRMSPVELRAALSLSSIFGLRMLGMFVILPVFAIYAENLPGGKNLTLVGIALGIYGLTQSILQIPFGWSLGEIPTGTPARGWYVNLHKSVGITLGAVIILRAVWRWFHPAPALPDWMPRWERIGANAIHAGLYACMLLMPLTGYVASNFSKWGVKYFNPILLPPWGVDDPRIYAFFNGAHVATSYIFLALILAHSASAFRHWWAA